MSKSVIALVSSGSSRGSHYPMGDYWKEIETEKAAPTNPASDTLVPTNKSLYRRAYAPAGWLWTLAALSIANLLLAYLRGPIRSSYALTIPEFAFEIGRAIHPLAMGLAFLFGGGLIGFTLWLGFLVRKFRR